MISHDLSLAVQCPTVGPQFPQDTPHSRSDIKAIETTEGNNFLNDTLVHQLVASQLQSCLSNPLA